MTRQPSDRLPDHLRDKPRCIGYRKNGEKCLGMAVKGRDYCLVHVRTEDPTWVEPERPLSRKKQREIELAARREAIDLRTAELLAEKAAAEAEANKIKGTRKGLIEALKSRFEHKPSIVTDIILEGLHATTTVRREVLDEDGTKLKIGDRQVYEDVVLPDHKIRLEYLREIYDRIHGRPAQRKEIEGGEGGVGVQVNVVGMLQAAAAASENPDAYYSSLPGQKVVDVPAENVVTSPASV